MLMLKDVRLKSKIRSKDWFNLEKRIADAVQGERSIRETSIESRIDVTEYIDENGGCGQDIAFEGDFGLSTCQMKRMGSEKYLNKVFSLHNLRHL